MKILLQVEKAKWILFLLSALCAAVMASSPARAQVPIVDPLSVTTPTPTPLPGAAPPFAEPTVLTLIDELSLVDATPESPAEPFVKPFVDPVHGFDRTRYYTVRPDDTLLDVALESGINLDEMWCVVSPYFTGQQPLVIGDILEIPPPDRACHLVAAGETLDDIAAQYDVLAEEIVAEPWNELREEQLEAEQSLSAGLHLRVPLPIDTTIAGEELIMLLTQTVGKSSISPMTRVNTKAKPVDLNIPDSWPFGSGNFRWPVSGWLSQGYHTRHRALDIASPLGTVVTAADRGVVIRAGWNHQGYGNLVIVDHKNDFLTLYAHLSEILVEEGQIVNGGEVIGEIGSTGNSTGPHLHFEIRDYGRLVDPLVKLMR